MQLFEYSGDKYWGHEATKERVSMPNNNENKNVRRELAKQIRGMRGLKSNPHIKIKKVSAHNKTGFVKVNIHGIDQPILFFTGKSLVGRTMIEKNDISEN
jgi:hypothetical protein